MSVDEKDTATSEGTQNDLNAWATKRRMVMKGSAVAALLTTVVSRPVWASRCSVSGNLSGNLSGQDNEEPCQLAIYSPSDWLNGLASNNGLWDYVSPYARQSTIEDLLGVSIALSNTLDEARDSYLPQSVEFFQDSGTFQDTGSLVGADPLLPGRSPRRDKDGRSSARQSARLDSQLSNVRTDLVSQSATTSAKQFTSLSTQSSRAPRDAKVRRTRPTASESTSFSGQVSSEPCSVNPQASSISAVNQPTSLRDSSRPLRDSRSPRDARPLRDSRTLRDGKTVDAGAYFGADSIDCVDPIESTSLQGGFFEADEVILEASPTIFDALGDATREWERQCAAAALNALLWQNLVTLCESDPGGCSALDKVHGSFYFPFMLSDIQAIYRNGPSAEYPALWIAGQTLR